VRTLCTLVSPKGNKKNKFWRELSDTPDIRGLEQPCLENLHPLATNGCSAIPRGLANRGHGIMETMRRRGSNGALAWPPATKSSVKPAWTFTVICTRKSMPSIPASRESDCAGDAGPAGGQCLVEQATDAFARSVREIASWDWSATWCWNTAMP
jgi:hypothetical protein